VQNTVSTRKHAHMHVHMHTLHTNTKYSQHDAYACSSFVSENRTYDITCAETGSGMTCITEGASYV
jgi:hypothetical protein